jgi:hypothetical protein
MPNNKDPIGQEVLVLVPFNEKRTVQGERRLDAQPAAMRDEVNCSSDA